MRNMFGVVVAGGLLCVAAACGGGDAGDTTDSELSGTIESDGSSTVFPIAQAMAEEFRLENPNVSVPVGMSGTGGGFKRFCAGQVPLSNASRPIKDTEAALCAENGIEFVEFTVAQDGMVVAVNPENAFAQCMTVEELKKLWEPGSQVNRWSQVRAGWPDTEIKLFGPGTNSGTFDYFTEEVVGEAGASRGDYSASEDDNTLVQGVAGEAAGLGYFGYAYYEENKAQVKAVAVDGGSGCVEPTPETVKDGTYTPLSRPLFVYVTEEALARPEVNAFLRFYMEHAADLVPQVGYIPLEPAAYQENLQRLTGTATPAADTAQAEAMQPAQQNSGD